MCLLTFSVMTDSENFSRLCQPQAYDIPYSQSAIVVSDTTYRGFRQVKYDIALDKISEIPVLSIGLPYSNCTSRA